MKRYLKTLRSEEAISKILEHTSPIDDEEYLPVYLCKARITSRPAFTRIPNPSFLCSAMDGYATSFKNTLEADLTNPVKLKRDIDATPVNTGDPIPSNADAVIMIEDVEESEAYITIRKPAYLWQHVRMIGEDVIEGDMLIPTNHKIKIFDIGMLISGGISHIHVKRKPRIAIIPTGKELIDIFEEPLEQRDSQGQAPLIATGRLIDFNSHTLLMLSEEMGFDAIKTRIARDKKMLEDILNEVIEGCDVILLNAGTSAGREDYTSDIITEMGTLIFHGVSMMPGKPTVFGVIKGKPVFGIPGYPVSAVLSFKTFVEPLYAKMSITGFRNKYIQCITPYKIPSRVGIEEIVRVNLIEKQGTYYAFPLPRGASVFSSMANADGLIRIPEDIEGYNENEEVQCEILGEEKDLEKRIHIIGSHDLSLDFLRDMMKVKHPDLDLISTHTGSLSGIFAFKKGVTQLCTTHILDETEKIYNIPILKKYLDDRPFKLFHIAKRSQGLLVRKGNPKNIQSIKDLVLPDIKFINRQAGSGTRILLDTMLKEQGVERHLINGYDREESSHTAVGILIRESIADVGVAIHSIARIFSLDFIPLAQEDYDLLVTKDFSEDRRFKMLMELITSDEFKKRLEDMGGYDTKDTGIIKYINK
jgi:putative molybdopterin biosynthesis protein